MAYDPGYAALGIPAPVFVQAKPSWSRPGSATAAAVVAFIVGGFSLMGAMAWFTGAKIAQGESFGAEWMMYGAIDFIVALALVVGASGLLGRQSWGRIALCLGAGIDVCYSSYRVVTAFTSDGFGIGSPFSILFPVLDAVIIVCVCLPATTHYLATRNPLYPGRASAYPPRWQ